ncbi:MAG TPA: hypothetical protein VH681_12145, partial [Nitrospiraceae bacterium]
MSTRPSEDQTPMTSVLLLHGGTIPHYRVPIYSYLSRYLRQHGFDLSVTSTAIQERNPHPVDFEFIELSLSLVNITRLIWRRQIDVMILFVDMRHLYLFPTYLIAKGIFGIKMVWWGQGRDLADQKAIIKNAAYTTEHALCDAIILYAEHLKKYVSPMFHRKIFVANNTLVFGQKTEQRRARAKEDVLASYGIRTAKNIICVGRFQKRKRIDRLVAAIQSTRRADIGLIL